MIVLSSDSTEAERQLSALQAMLSAIGQAQANFLGSVPNRFANAESRALSKVQQDGKFVLRVDQSAAQSGRSPQRVSWVFRRLHEMASSEAEVRVSTQSQVTAFLRAQGGTRPTFETYTLPGRGYFRLPGPVRLDNVSVATVHPRTGANRTVLAIGRTLVHELVIHAWRDIFFYQRVPGTSQPASDLAMSSEHHDRPHRPNSLGQHSLSDAEADLIDYYYDLAMGNTLAFGERTHPGFGQKVRALGGVMGSRIPTLGAHRRSAAEYAIEQARFLNQASQFRQQMDRMQRLESRVSR